MGGSIAKLDFQDSESLQAVAMLADMYQIPTLAAACAQVLCGSVSEANIILVLRCLGLLSGTSPAIQSSLDNVIEQVQERPALLRAVCMLPSTVSTSIASYSHHGAKPTSMSPMVDLVDSATQTDAAADAS